MRVGVLAMQGAFVEHEQVLARLGVEPVQVRLPQHLDELDGLILPGGESTAIGRLLQRWGLVEPIRAFAQSGRALWGTCAGLILMAKEVVDGTPGQLLLELMDIRVRRNAMGRQVDSFEVNLEVPVLGKPPFRAILIRAPAVEGIGRTVEVLTRLGDGTPVAVQQGNLLATTFHPELTDDDRFHRLFVGLCEQPGIHGTS